VAQPAAGKDFNTRDFAAGLEIVMEYTRLGNTGLEVSRLCLGCMTYGEPDRGSHTIAVRPDQDTSHPAEEHRASNRRGTGLAQGIPDAGESILIGFVDRDQIIALVEIDVIDLATRNIGFSSDTAPSVTGSKLRINRLRS